MMADLRDEFRAACDLYMTSAFGGRLDESAQRELYGLHARATRGPAPAAHPEGMAAEQWEAWREASEKSATAEEAMEAYISAVEIYSLEAADEDDAAEAAAAGGGGVESLPRGLREQLEAAGLVPSATPLATAAAARRQTASMMRRGLAATRPWPS